MDGRRFDSLARSIHAIHSRRSVLAALTGAALAGTLGLDERAEASNHKLADAKCSSDSQCANGICLKYGRCKMDGRLTGKCRCACGDDPECGPGRVCRKTACFSECSPAGICGALEECGSGNCGCFNAEAAGAVCVFTGRNRCLTEACVNTADCPDGYVCAILQPIGTDQCCGGKTQTCMAPCQVKSVQPA